VLFILFLPSTACAHDGSEFEQYYFWFLLVVVFWAIVISTFSMWFAYSLFKEAMRKNRSNNYLLDDGTEPSGESSVNRKQRIYNEELQTAIDVNLQDP
jgi:hypothetical protein